MYFSKKSGFFSWFNNATNKGGAECQRKKKKKILLHGGKEISE